jgi:hypothetical protein
MLIKGLLLTLYILRWSLELLLIYIEVPVPNHQNTSSWFGNCSQSVVFFFYILSQHLDHLQQLDNLEHSAHLYGQLTTVGLFTTIWSCTTFELLTIVCLFTTISKSTTSILVAWYRYFNVNEQKFQASPQNVQC